MRIMVMFDLPTKTAGERREYSKFRRFLVKSGFLMMQESVYSKIASNPTMGDAFVENLRKNKPPSGLVQVLKVTEKQYSKMIYLVGQANTEVLDTDERIVII